MPTARSGRVLSGHEVIQRRVRHCGACTPYRHDTKACTGCPSTNHNARNCPTNPVMPPYIGEQSQLSSTQLPSTPFPGTYGPIAPNTVQNWAPTPSIPRPFVGHGYWELSRASLSQIGPEEDFDFQVPATQYYH
jgi:hypothetical protein